MLMFLGVQSRGHLMTTILRISPQNWWWSKQEGEEALYYAYLKEYTSNGVQYRTYLGHFTLLFCRLHYKNIFNWIPAVHSWNFFTNLCKLFLHWLNISLMKIRSQETHTTVNIKTNTTLKNNKNTQYFETFFTQLRVNEISTRV